MIPLAARRALLIGLGTSIVPLDTAVNIAFPAITQNLGVPIGAIQWIVIAYVLTYASLLLAFGRIGDMFGHLTVFRLGLAWSAVALLLCAAAPSYPWLLAGRIGQGIGSALVLACGPALLTSLYPESSRARALGLYTMMVAIGGAVGPLVGGVLVDHFGWSAVFWFRAPIALVALVTLRGLTPTVQSRIAREPFDISGAVLLALALAALLFALNRLPDIAQQNYAALWFGLATALTFAGFVWRENSARAPMIDLGVFRSLDFSLINGTSVVINLANFAVLLLAPYYLAQVGHLSAALGGLVLAVGAAGTIAGSPTGAWLMRLMAPGRVALLGAALCSIGLARVGAEDAESGLALMAAMLCLQGFGLGLFQVAYAELVIGAIPIADRGVAGSLTMLTRTIGVISGATVLTLTFQYFQSLVSSRSETVAFLAGFRLSFLFASALVGAMVLILLLRGGLRRR
jgi:MFS family permease